MTKKQMNKLQSLRDEVEELLSDQVEKRDNMECAEMTHLPRFEQLENDEMNLEELLDTFDTVLSELEGVA